MKKQKKGNPVIGCLSLIIIILCIVFIVNILTNESSNIDKSLDIEIDPTSLTLEELVDYAVDKTRVEKEKITINNDLGKGEGKIIRIDLKGKSRITTNSTRNNMFMEATDIFKILQGNEEISSVTIWWSLELVDTYGNISEPNVMRIHIDKETLDKINFENFNFNNILTVADSYFEHPIFRED